MNKFGPMPIDMREMSSDDILLSRLKLLRDTEYRMVLFDFFDGHLNQGIEKSVFPGDMHGNIVGCDAF